MAKMFIGLTDYDWYDQLRSANFDEVNFWRPGNVSFRALEPNGLFLFKLKSPHHAIVGGGFFVQYTKLPLPLAWEAFGEKNGTGTYLEFANRIQKYREKNRMDRALADVGCIILAQPFFFDRADWIAQPRDWSPNTVVGKTLDTASGEGERIYREVQARLQPVGPHLFSATGEEPARYLHTSTNVRLGQGAFRVLVTDTYERRCAVSGEKTLPVLEAAHIKPYAQAGPHLIQNGILLRSDIHRLFDNGYVTIDRDLRVEVSKRLYEDFGNGKIYYPFHGKKLLSLPHRREDYPDPSFLSWHNEKIYLG